MNLKQFGLNIEIIYEVMIVSERKMAVITPVMTINSVERKILIARVEVDGHELTPCAKIIAEPGDSTVRMRPVKIINPLRGRNGSDENRYRMTMEISPAANEFEIFEQQISIVVE